MTLLDDAPDLDAPWEPWHPAVGQRVRVLLSGECRGIYFPAVECGHWPNLHERTGHIYGTCKDRSGHRYLVLLDKPLEVDEWPSPVSHFQLAAIELEPLDSQP